MPYLLKDVDKQYDIIDTEKISVDITKETFEGKWLQIFNKSPNKEYGKNMSGVIEFVLKDDSKMKIIKEYTKNGISITNIYDDVTYNFDKTISYSLYDDNLHPQIFYVLAKTTDLMAVGTTDGKHLSIYSKDNMYYHLHHLFYQLNKCGVDTNIFRGCSSSSENKLKNMIRYGFSSGMEYDVWKLNHTKNILIDIFEALKN